MSYSLTTSKDSTTTHHTTQISMSCEVVQTLKPLLLPLEMDDNSYCTAENSQQYCPAASQGCSSRRVPFTHTKSDGCTSLLCGYSDCPSYMAYTESARAKMRSLSAPKQWPQYERTSSAKRYSVHGVGEHYPRSNAHRLSSILLCMLVSLARLTLALVDWLRTCIMPWEFLFLKRRKYTLMANFRICKLPTASLPLSLVFNTWILLNIE